jgi:hypothetical protein
MAGDVLFGASGVIGGRFRRGLSQLLMETDCRLTTDAQRYGAF